MIAIDIPMPNNCTGCPMMLGCEKLLTKHRPPECPLFPVKKIMSESRSFNPTDFDKHKRHNQIATLIMDHPELFVEEQHNDEETDIYRVRSILYVVGKREE